jgi:hypothetical protein
MAHLGTGLSTGSTSRRAQRRELRLPAPPEMLSSVGTSKGLSVHKGRLDHKVRLAQLARREPLVRQARRATLARRGKQDRKATQVPRDPSVQQEPLALPGFMDPLDHKYRRESPITHW